MTLPFLNCLKVFTRVDRNLFYNTAKYKCQQASPLKQIVFILEGVLVVGVGDPSVSKIAR